MTDLDQERADLNALVRTAHEAIKDLTRLNREADERMARADAAANAMIETIDEFQAKVTELAQVKIADVVDETFAPAIDTFVEGLAKHVAEVQQAIYARFDAVTEELTAGKGRIAWDDLSLPDYMKKKEG